MLQMPPVSAGGSPPHFLKAGSAWKAGPQAAQEWLLRATLAGPAVQVQREEARAMSGPLPALLVPIPLEMRPGQVVRIECPCGLGAAQHREGQGLPSPWSQHMLSACARSRGRAEGSCLRVLAWSLAPVPNYPMSLGPSLSRAWTSHLHGEGAK